MDHQGQVIGRHKEGTNTGRALQIVVIRNVPEGIRGQGHQTEVSKNYLEETRGRGLLTVVIVADQVALELHKVKAIEGHLRVVKCW